MNIGCIKECWRDYSPEGGNGRPHTKWLDSVLMVARGWRGRVGDRADLRRVAEEAKAHQGL
jgi:hypothetical protein